MTNSINLKLSEEGKFRYAVNTALFAGLSAGAFATAHAQEANSEEATQLDVLEVTGSRVGRADIEGALPVAVISREQIDTSGFTSVGELLRNTTFNSFGAFRAQSGSSAQALVAVDLRGLGSERTLVLIDGQRAPKAPYAPTAQDLNAVPIAMVERIEVLKDGASAIYGSDAIAGVINIITRKDYDGVAVSYQEMGTERDGGDSRGLQMVGGVTGERGNVVFGASAFSRDIIYARDSLFSSPGASFFSNNYVLSGFVDDDGDFFDDNTGNYYYGAVPGGCPPPGTNPGYFEYGSGLGLAAGLCGFDFNQVAADEARTRNQSVFVRSNYQIAKDWRLKSSASVARATSFGRYAPSLNDVPLLVSADNPNNTLPTPQDFYLYHRFAALGNRNNETDANVYDLTNIVSGTLFSTLNIDVGYTHNTYQFYDIGRNYVVLPIAQSFIDSGTYNFLDPVSANTATTLSGMKATVGRDSIWKTQGVFADADLPVFKLLGGDAKLAFGGEYRSEKYFDFYDSLSEGGAIGGSAGNSSGSDRRIGAGYFELFMPFMDELEVTLSARHENYNDVGSSTVPKLSARYQPTDDLTLRASLGQGFRAPTLDIISALPTFSAEAINNDEATCYFAGGTFSGGTCSVQAQVNTTIVSNPDLVAEESDQFAIGFAYDVSDEFNFSLDFYSIAISDRIDFLSPGDLIDLVNRGTGLPAGLSITRSPIPIAPAPNGRITGVVAGYANSGDLDTTGIDIEANLDLNMGPGGTLETAMLANYILTWDISNPDGTVDERAGWPAYPEYRITLNNSYTNPMVQGLAFQLNMNHIADQAQNVDAQGNTSGTIPSYTTWDVQVGYDIPMVDGLNLAVGALNVFGREPSARSAFDGRDYNFYLYDQYGTQPYGKVTWKF